MQTFTALLTAAILAVHAALGCCWHHGHSHPLATAGSPTSAHACAAGHEHGERHGHHGAGHHGAGHHGAGHDGAGHHGERHEEAPGEKAPCGGQCEKGACVFMAGGKPVLPDDCQTPMPLDGRLDASSEVRHLAVLIRTGDVPLALPPPLRLHLAKCVLLI